MGGRDSGGSRNGGGGATSKSEKPIGEGITDRNELINLYNSISGNPSYTVEQRVQSMKSIKERIDKLDADKAETLKQKRLDALKKAREKRAENLKNGIKPTPKKPKEKNKSIPSDEKISQMVRKIAPDSRGWEWESNGREITVHFKESKKVKNSTWNKLIKKLGDVGISDVMIDSK